MLRWVHLCHFGVDEMKKQKNILGVAMLIAAVLALAASAAAEILTVRRSNAELPEKVELAAGDFYGWEFDTTDKGYYYTLAYNSYFEIDGIDVGRVTDIEVYMNRSDYDVTETVLYWHGVKSGIEGEFMMALSETSDGVWTASCDIQSLDYIRFYPTEKVRSDITFDGIVLNGNSAPSTVSVPRIAVMWLAASAVLSGIYIFICFIKNKKAPTHLTALVSVMASAAGGVAGLTAGGMFTAASAIGDMLGLFAAAAMFAVWWLMVWIVRIKKTENRAFAAVLLLGSLFAVVGAPLQAPDETFHFIRAYTVSELRFDFDYDYKLPDDVELMYSCFPAEMNNGKLLYGGRSVTDAMKLYFAGGTVDSEHKSNVQLILPYIPAAVGIAAARLFTSRALFMMWAARIAQAVFYAFCVRFALKKAKRYRSALILMTLFPMTLFMVSMVSYDSMFLSSFAVFAGLCLGGTPSRRDIAAMIVSFAVIVMIKPIYIPLALLMMLMPAQELAAKRRMSIIAACIISGILLWLASLWYASAVAVNITATEDLAGVDRMAQIKYVLSQPIRYIAVMLVDGYQNLFYLGTFGMFGTLDVSARLTNLISPCVAAVVSVLSARETEKLRKGDIWLCSELIVGMYVLIVTGFYVTWSTLGSTSILGVQSRYFIPLILPASLLISKASSRFVTETADTQNTALALTAALSAVSVVEIFAEYYLM